MTDHTFEGAYSDGEKLTGKKTKTLESCKKDNLAL